MTDAMKWKSKLLSSSVPLEYEAARILVSKGFSVDADYIYRRRDGSDSKDFSVDLNATAYPPFSNPCEISATLELLVECKYRQQQTKWLFFPDPNHEDFSSSWLGTSLRAVDAFCPLFLNANAALRFDAGIAYCLKGVEVDLANGSAHDAEIRRGVSQLQYAIPRLLKELILQNLMGHQEDNHPFFFCPILVTTAELFLADRSITSENIGLATQLSDVAKLVDRVIIRAPSSPEFDAHLQSTFSDERIRNADLFALDRARLDGGESSYRLPSEQLRSLSQAGRSRHTQYFSHQIVCSMHGFLSLISDIKSVTSAILRTRRKRKH